MGLKDFYYNLEEKYYNFLDWLDSKGVPLYKVDDWLHNHGVAGFPVFILFCLIILALIVWGILALTMIGPEQATVYLTFKDTTRNMLVTDLPVTVLIGSETQTLTTDGSGTISFVSEVGEVVPISISNQDYKLLEETFTITENGQKGIIELEYSGGLLSKTIFFYDGDDSTNQSLYTGKVDAIITCTDNSNYLAEVSTTDGKATVDDLAYDCGQMVVTLQAPSYDSASFSLDETSPSFTVKGGSEGFGIISVTVLDADGNPKANAMVKAMSLEYNLQETQGITQASGVIQLTVPADKEYYLIVTDAEGLYASENTDAPYSTENEFTSSVGVGQTVSKIITLSKKTVGSIKLSIKDNLGNAVTSGIVKVYKNNVEEASNQITEDGTFEWPVGDNSVAYRFVIDSDKFMLEEIDNLYASESVYSVTLKPIKQSIELTVLVNGTDNEPVYNASVQLFNVEKDTLLVTKSTDVAGGVTFANLNSGKSYLVKVVKGNFSAESQPVTLSGKIENVLTVKLNIGSGDLSVLALSKDGLPVQGAEINIYDIVTDAKLNQAPLYTDETGVVSYTLRADKVVYLKVVKDSSVYYSLPTQADIDVTKAITVYVYDKATALGLDLIGIYDSQGNIVESNPKPIVAGEEYSAYLLLRVPEGLAYDEMGVFFKADDALSLEKSGMYLKSLEFFNGVTKMGTTYTPPNGTADDLQSLSSKEGLWASSIVTKTAPGNYLVKVVFGTLNAEKSLLSLNYRSWLKKGSTYVREPFDSELGTSASTDKDGMYAKTNSISFKQGNVVCSGAVCSEIVISGEGVKQKVLDSFYAKVNGIYNIDIIKMIGVSAKEYKNVTLSIESPNKGLEIKAKTMNVKIAGLTINSSFNLSGSLEMRVLKEGTNILKISLVGDDGTLVYERAINVTVDPSKELFLDLVPSTIVPYLENKLSVRAYDLDVNEPVSNAIVNLYVENKLMNSLKTDGDGYAVFELPALNVGTKVKLQALAGGYKTLEKELIVSENILMTDVPELTITVDRSVSDFIEGSLNVTNLTPLKLKIVNLILVDGEYKDYLKFSFKKNYVNMFLSGDANTLSMEYKVELTQGKNLLEPKEFETKMMIELAAEGLNYKWNMALPVKMYVKLAGGTDSADCLKLVPITDTADELWQILVSEEKQKVSQSFEIQNNCKVGGNDVYLYNPTIEVVWNGKVLGDLLVEGKKLGKKEMSLYPESGTSSNYLAPGITNLDVDFISAGDIVSGKSTVTLRIKAKNPTSNGLQELKAEAKAEAVVSVLSKCLQVVSAQGSGMQVNGVPVVILNANNYGMMGLTGAGYGYGSMMGYNSLGMGSMYGSQMYGANNVYNSPYFTQTGAGLANRPGMVAQNNWAMNSMNPNMAYQYNQYNPYSSMYGGYGSSYGGYGGYGGYGSSMYGGYGSGYMNPMYGGMAIPSVAQLQIRNTCEYPVEVELQAMPQLWIEGASFTVSPGQTQAFKISSTSMVGQYAVYVMAGINKGLMLPISQIPVMVRDMMNETSNDCFVIEGGKTIDFSSVGVTPMYKMIKMWNKCYARGLTMDKAEPVTYNNLLLIDEITGQPKDLQGKPTEFFYATTKVIGTPQASTYEGLMAEEFEVMFTKNPEILKSGTEISESPDTFSGTIDKLSDIRKLSAETLSLAKTPALLTFKYTLAYAPRSTSIMVYIKDNMNLLGGIAKLSQELLKGNPDCGPDKWDPHIAKGNTNIQIPIEIKNGMFVENSFTYPQSGSIEIMEISKACFSSMDTVKYYGPLEFDVDTKDKGAKIHVVVTPGDNGQTLKVKYTKPNVLAEGWHDVKVSFQGEVHRNGYKDTKAYTFSITARIEGEDGVKESSGTTTAEKIKEGEAGGAAGADAAQKCVSLYGNEGLYLDIVAYKDIKYEWNPKEIGKTFCDIVDAPYSGKGYFCDQYQFTAELENKYVNLKDLFGNKNTIGEVIKEKVATSVQGNFVKTSSGLLEFIGYLGGYESEIGALKDALGTMATGTSYDLTAAKTAVNGMAKCYFTDLKGSCPSSPLYDKDRFYVRISGKNVCDKAKTGTTLKQNLIAFKDDLCYLKMSDILSANWGDSWKDVAKAIGTGQTVMVFSKDDPYTSLEIERFISALGSGNVGELTAEKLRSALFKANLMPGKYGAEFYADNYSAGYTITNKVKMKSGSEVKKAGTYFIEIQKSGTEYVFVPTFVDGTEKTDFVYKFPLELPVTKGRTINFNATLPTGKDISIGELPAGNGNTDTYAVIKDNLDRLFRGVVFEIGPDMKLYNSKDMKYLALLTSDLSKVKSLKAGDLELSWVPKGSIISSTNKVKSGEAKGEFTSVMYNNVSKSWEKVDKTTKSALKYKKSTGDYSGSIVSTPTPDYLPVDYIGILDAFKDSSRNTKKYCVSVGTDSMKIWVNENVVMSGT